MVYDDQKLCELVESRINGMSAVDGLLFREVVRRLRILTGAAEDVVLLSELAVDLNVALGSALDRMEQMRSEMELLRVESRVLHVRYDLKETGCGAVLREDGNEYYVSNLQLVEMLQARRDGRMVILQEEGADG